MKFIWSSHEVQIKFEWSLTVRISRSVREKFIWISREIDMKLIWISFEINMNCIRTKVIVISFAIHMKWASRSIVVMWINYHIIARLTHFTGIVLHIYNWFLWNCSEECSSDDSYVCCICQTKIADPQMVRCEHGPNCSKWEWYHSCCLGKDEDHVFPG